MGIGRSDGPEQFSNRIAPNARPLVLGGTLFDKMMAHIGQDPLVKGICMIDYDGIKFERRSAPVRITAPAETNASIVVVIEAVRAKFVFGIDPDGTVSHRIKVTENHRLGQRQIVNTIVADKALATLTDVINGFRPEVDDAEENADSKSEADSAKKAE